MARTESVRGQSRSQQRRTQNGRTYVYVDGTAVRKLQQAPAEEKRQRQTPSASRRTRKNRERALQMNFAYVAFLAAAAVLTVFMCVNFLQLRARGTKLQKEVTALEAQLDAAVLENNSNYQGIITSVDMDHVRDVAMNELGMQKATKDQIVTYEVDDSDYVRQYSEIPAE